MAVVREFAERELNGSNPHSEVEATVSLVEVDGEKFVQIDTYGSNNRAMPGKVSQSLRLSKSALDQLVQLAEKHF